MTVQTQVAASRTRGAAPIKSMPRARRVRWAGFGIALTILVSGLTVGGATVEIPVDNSNSPAAVSRP
jgi:hypothetical protein